MVARAHGLDLTCLGFGGQCHIDPLVGRTIGLLPADRISLKLGINTYGGSSFTQRTWGPAVAGLIMGIRERHPATPMLVVSPIMAPPCETAPNAADMTLQMMRQTLSELVATLRDRGDGHLHYLDGRALLGPDDLPGHMSDDGVHPTAAGYELIGRRFAELAFGDGGPLALDGE
jgi:lysophospholipase L1-like esterase